jgi:hypothetical protein
METFWASLYGWHEVKMKWFFLGFWLATGLFIFGMLRQRGNHTAAWIGTALWFILPYNMANFHGGAISGYADVPFALGLLIAIWALAHYSRSANIPEALLMGFLISGTFWVKREGLLILPAVIVFLILKRCPWRTLGIVCVTIILLILIHYLSVYGIPDHLEKDVDYRLSMAELSSRLVRYPALILEEFKAGDHWGHRLWYLLLCGWVLKIMSHYILPGFIGTKNRGHTFSTPNLFLQFFSP